MLPLRLPAADMNELFQESLLPVNLPFTLLLGAIALYWIIGLLGLVDLDGGTEGVDGELALDGADALDGPDTLDGGEALDAGAESGDGDDGSAGGGGIFRTVLKIVGASDAPLIFVVSLFTIFLWACSVLANHYFNPGFDAGRATVLLAPVVVTAFVLTRILVVPLRPLTKFIRSSEKPVEIVGATGRVRSSQIDTEFGEVEVEASGRTLLLRARISASERPLLKGDRILVVSRDPETGICTVRALEH